MGSEHGATAIPGWSSSTKHVNTQGRVLSAQFHHYSLQYGGSESCSSLHRERSGGARAPSSEIIMVGLWSGVSGVSGTPQMPLVGVGRPIRCRQKRILRTDLARAVAGRLGRHEDVARPGPCGCLAELARTGRAQDIICRSLSLASEIRTTF